MISFLLNGKERKYDGNMDLSLLNYLREKEGITSPKDGCSGQAFCGACMVEVDGKAVLSCVTKMKKLDGAKIVTIEGFPDELRRTLGRAFVDSGAVQCGFCTPGFLTRTKVLLETNPDPSRDEIIDALKFNYCRCTGYLKIVEAIEKAARAVRENKEIVLSKEAGAGKSYPKYDGYKRAVGESPFVADLKFDGMVYGALRFSDYPRARVKKIDISRAKSLQGVIRVFTSKDIPGERYNGLIYNDWPLMVEEGGITRYIGDVLAGVVAETEDIAREAVGLIQVDYEVLEPVTDMLKAEDSPVKVHEKGNLLEECVVCRGDNIDDVLENSDFVVEGEFETQRIEHAFMETECAVAMPWKDGGIQIYSQSQGVYEDRRQICRILNLPEDKVNVTLVPNGGGFGGKEDMSVQGQTALFAYLLNRPVRIHLTRDESIRVHPKRHPMVLRYKLGCDANGMFTGIRARIWGDTGAYASVGTKVLERAAGHATGAYYFPSVDLIAKTLYTNNVPCGAMRGFGANQAIFALEVAIDEICEKGGFDRWQLRYDNALVNGLMTSTGQVLHKGVGVRETLLAVKDEYDKSIKDGKTVGIACAIKNCGVGNGMNDESEAKIEIRSADKVIVHHGWTEMGQGANTIALQTLCEETGIDPSIVEVVVSTEYQARAGMTTSSRGTSLIGNSVIEACKELKKDLKSKKLSDLVGKTYYGKWVCDWTTKPGAPGEVITHYSYSYATQLVVLDKEGKIETVYAAHDAGKIMNPTLFEGQIQGSVHMGMGYALTEDLPMEGGFLKSTRMRDLGVMRIKDVPPIIVKGVEVPDPLGPYGAKGVGEIGLVPTAGAVVNAFNAFDKVKRHKLPIMR